MNALFGTGPLFEMRNEVDVNPLIQMTALGKSIIDAAFFNILAGGAIEVAGGVLQNLDGWQKFGAGLNTMGDAWFVVAMIGLGIGLILYYVVPFLPFIYFFFSVIKWLQSIFEAMIGMPMWALAHLRINGDGIPPEAAENGYYLLFEIFLRPTLTIFGLVASFIIFTGMVYAINDVFDLLTVNLTGYSPPSTGSMVVDLELKRGTIDQFFYSVMYVILVYITATMSFKLIDMIPAQILRWAGSGAKNIIDEAVDPVPGMIRSVYVGSFGLPLIQQGGMMGQAVTGIRQAVEGTGQLMGKGLQGALKPANKGVSNDGE
jgi:conjugal transfer/type IV secretion protein DotA/TraY